MWRLPCVLGRSAAEPPSKHPVEVGQIAEPPLGSQVSEGQSAWIREEVFGTLLGAQPHHGLAECGGPVLVQEVKLADRDPEVLGDRGRSDLAVLEVPGHEVLDVLPEYRAGDRVGGELGRW